MVVSISGNLIDGGIYHHDWNEETRPTVVSEHDEVAGGAWATIAPNRASRLACCLRAAGGCGGLEEAAGRRPARAEHPD